MNYFEEGEKLKAMFDTLIKQHKKTKKKTLESNNVNKETLDKHEECRLELMRFFEQDHSFIRPRKNSFGVFSVEDFVKFKTREAESLLKSTDMMSNGYFDEKLYRGRFQNDRNEMMYRRNTISGVFPFPHGVDGTSRNYTWNNQQGHFPMMGDHITRYPGEGIGFGERNASHYKSPSAQNDIFTWSSFEGRGSQQERTSGKTMFEMGEFQGDGQVSIKQGGVLGSRNLDNDELNQFLGSGFDFSNKRLDAEALNQGDFISDHMHGIPSRTRANPGDMVKGGRMEFFTGFEAPSMHMRDMFHNNGFLGGRTGPPYSYTSQGEGASDGMRAAYSPPIGRQDLLGSNFRFVSNLEVNPYRKYPNEDSIERSPRFNLFYNRTADIHRRSNSNTKGFSSLYQQAYEPFRDGSVPTPQFFPPFGMNPNDLVPNISTHPLARDIPPASNFTHTSGEPVAASYGVQEGAQLFNVIGGKYPSQTCLYGTLQCNNSLASKPKGRRGRKPKNRGLMQTPYDFGISGSFASGRMFGQDWLTSSDMVFKNPDFDKKITEDVSETSEKVLRQRQDTTDLGLESRFETVSRELFGDQDMVNPEMEMFNPSRKCEEEGFDRRVPELDSGVMIENVSGSSRKIEDILEITGLDDPIDNETKVFIYELCDGFIEHMMHMSCALAYHRNKNTVEMCDVRLTLKTEVGLEFPEDFVYPLIRSESEEHVKKMKMIEKDNSK